MAAYLRPPLMLLALVLNLASTGADVATFDPCFRVIDRASSTIEDDAIARLKSAHGRVGHNSRDVVESVDARRLVNRGDWAVAQSQLGDRAHLAYSARTWDAWVRAAQYARTHAHKGLTPDLLKRINFEAMDGLPLHGFEGRRLRLAYDQGEMTREQLKAKLADVYEKDANPSGVDHHTLVGKFRSDPLDEIKHAGSSYDRDIGRYFTKDELEAARQNPHMRVDAKSVKEVRPGVFEAVSYYTAPGKVPASVDKVFEALNRDLAAAQKDYDVVRAVARMQKDLVVIHPFLDGNGRSVRLLGDLILERRGLPPPLLGSEEELTKSVNELTTDMIEGMEKYVEQTRAQRARAIRQAS